MKYLCKECDKYKETKDFSKSSDRYGMPSSSRVCDECLRKCNTSLGASEDVPVMVDVDNLFPHHTDRFDGLTNAEGNVVCALNSIGVTKILRNGWPDFVAVIKGFPVFIEVKSGPDDLPRPNQVKMHNLLKGLGLDVIVINGAQNSATLSNKLKVLFHKYFQ